jgi:hypothetical protein|tara:strand:- start:596 stop:772 length:177 start_codon:yes stop_codon:yes gene_type:complete
MTGKPSEATGCFWHLPDLHSSAIRLLDTETNKAITAKASKARKTKLIFNPFEAKNEKG